MENVNKAVECSSVNLEVFDLDETNYVELFNVFSRSRLPVSKDCMAKQSDVERWSVSRMLPPNCSPRQNHSLGILNVFIKLHETIAHGLHVTDSLSNSPCTLISHPYIQSRVEAPTSYMAVLNVN